MWRLIYQMKRLIEGILGQTKGHSYVTTGDGVACNHSDLILIWPSALCDMNVVSRNLMMRKAQRTPISCNFKGRQATGLFLDMASTTEVMGGLGSRLYNTIHRPAAFMFFKNFFESPMDLVKIVYRIV